MPLFRQLELRFENHNATVVGQAPRLPAARIATEAVALQSIARKLLRSNGAERIANKIRIQWNSRLKTCVGRADYGSMLISLNLRLRDHLGEVDRTLRHELAHLLAQFRAGRKRISPHGEEWRKACVDLGIHDEKRCHNLPFATKRYVARYVYRCPNCREQFARVRRIRRPVACLACCRTYNRGNFDPRFRLKLVGSQQKETTTAKKLKNGSSFPLLSSV